MIRPLAIQGSTLRQMGSRSRGFGLFAVVALVSFAVGGTIGFGRATDDAVAAADRPAADYPAILVSASEALTVRLTSEPGVAFTVRQETWLDARPDGPKISLGDPSDPGASPRLVERAYVQGVIARGVISDSGFWSESRDGIEPGDAIDFERGRPLVEVIGRAGQLWRNDADQGWRVTDIAPGHGMDPQSAGRMPGLLRHLQAIEDLGEQTIDGKVLRRFQALAANTEYPGVIASDGLLFTASPIVVSVWIDPFGRLDRMTAEAINLNETEADLSVSNMLIFEYDDVPAIPDLGRLIEPDAEGVTP